MWWGLPWWVWVFVVPELVVMFVWLVVGVPMALLADRSEDRRRREAEERRR